MRPNPAPRKQPTKAVGDFSDLAAALMRRFDPERAHTLTILGLKLGEATGLRPFPAASPPDRLAVNALGLHFPSPIGLAAGFDKNAEVPDAMLRFGFGFVEVGSITPKPQSGNPKPRIFRLPEERGVINRLGFNNRGLEEARARLTARRRRGIVAANVGPNKDAADPLQDYATCIRALAPLADMLVLNVSSPNTPGLRDLQKRLDELLATAFAARADSGASPPILVKIAPDLDQGEIEAIVGAAIARGAHGLIVGNTSVGRREGLKGRHRGEKGGLSGKPLFAFATRALTVAARAANRRIVLVGVGGVSSGADAYAKIRAGATLVELYTAMIYEGPGIVARIHEELAELLARDGFRTVADAVGADL